MGSPAGGSTVPGDAAVSAGSREFRPGHRLRCPARVTRRQAGAARPWPPASSRPARSPPASPTPSMSVPRPRCGSAGPAAGSKVNRKGPGGVDCADSRLAAEPLVGLKSEPIGTRSGRSPRLRSHAPRTTPENYPTVPPTRRPGRVVRHRPARLPVPRENHVGGRRAPAREGDQVRRQNALACPRPR